MLPHPKLNFFLFSRSGLTGSTCTQIPDSILSVGNCRHHATRKSLLTRVLCACVSVGRNQSYTDKQILDLIIHCVLPSSDLTPLQHSSPQCTLLRSYTSPQWNLYNECHSRRLGFTTVQLSALLSDNGIRGLAVKDINPGQEISRAIAESQISSRSMDSLVYEKLKVRTGERTRAPTLLTVHLCFCGMALIC